MDADLKQLKVISRGEDGDWERVPVPGGHKDKRVGESASSIFIQFGRGAERSKTARFS